MAVRYLEAHPLETWKQASRSFWTWFQKEHGAPELWLQRGRCACVGQLQSPLPFACPITTAQPQNCSKIGKRSKAVCSGVWMTASFAWPVATRSRPPP